MVQGSTEIHLGCKGNATVIGSFDTVFLLKVLMEIGTFKNRSKRNTKVEFNIMYYWITANLEHQMKTGKRNLK